MSLIVSNKLYKNNSKLGNTELKLFLNVSKKIIAANNKTKPLAASSLKNQIKGFDK